MGSSLFKKGLLPILLLISKNQNLTEVRRVNTASTISQRDAYKLMLKDNEIRKMLRLKDSSFNLYSSGIFAARAPAE